MAYLCFKGRIKETRNYIGDAINTIEFALQDGRIITIDRDYSEMEVDRPDGAEYAEDFCHYESVWKEIYDLDEAESYASFIDEAAYISDDDINDFKGAEIASINIEDDAPTAYKIYIDEFEFVREEKSDDEHLIERPLDSCV